MLASLPDWRDRLANATWHALNGFQAGHALARGRARRFAPGLAPVAAFEDPAWPDLNSLAAISPPGEKLYLPGIAQLDHPAFQVLASANFLQMVRPQSRARMVSGAPVRRLREADAAELSALVDLCGLVPSGAGMLRVGEHFGIHDDGGRLVAAAALRLSVAGWREVSTVCTHPDARGRGHASKLVQEASALIESAGQVPFLHVDATDRAAIAIYARCGFEPLQVLPLLVVRRA